MEWKKWGMMRRGEQSKNELMNEWINVNEWMMKKKKKKEKKNEQ